MMYTARRSELAAIVQWLEGSDESQWEEVTILISQTISNLQDLPRQAMAKGADSAEGPSSEPDSFSAQATAVNVAIPQLMEMLKAMHDHNRAAALEYGQGALGLLPVE
jgi:hypothetical protein